MISLEFASSCPAAAIKEIIIILIFKATLRFSPPVSTGWLGWLQEIFGLRRWESRVLASPLPPTPPTPASPSNSCHATLAKATKRELQMSRQREGGTEGGVGDTGTASLGSGALTALGRRAPVTSLSCLLSLERPPFWPFQTLRLPRPSTRQRLERTLTACWRSNAERPTHTTHISLPHPSSSGLQCSPHFYI